jgi:hypothetical protein
VLFAAAVDGRAPYEGCRPPPPARSRRPRRIRVSTRRNAPCTTNQVPHPAPQQHQQGQGLYAVAAAGVLGKPRDSYAAATARETYAALTRNASSLPGVTGTSSLGATHAYSAPAPLQTSHMYDKMTSPTRYGCRGNGIHTRA